MLNREQRTCTRQHILVAKNGGIDRFICYKPCVTGPVIFRLSVVSFGTCGKEQMALQRHSWREARKFSRNKAGEVCLEACGYYCVGLRLFSAALTTKNSIALFKCAASKREGDS